MSLLTKRIPTIVGILVLVAGVFGGIYFVNSRKQSPNVEATMPKKVRVTNVADNKFTVSWVTDSPATGLIFYGKLGEKIDSQTVDDRDAIASTAGSFTTHHVTVKDLQPSTQYAFRIASGSEKSLYDNNGSPYNVTTGSVLSTTPAAETIYGSVVQTSTLPAEGAIVYLEIPGGTPLSTLVKSSGNWTLPISIARNRGMTAYVQYDPSATVLTIRVEDGKLQASASVNTANSAPVPDITMGQTYDFLQSPLIGDDNVIEDEAVSEDLLAEDDSTPGIFNIDPLGDIATASSDVTLINPSKEGEIVSTTLPAFRGAGEEGMVLTITVKSEPQTGTVVIESDGTWEWTPPNDLEPGEHTITIAYLDLEGVQRILKRTFVVEASSGLPSFESTPSASIAPSPSSSAFPSPSPRVELPSTDSGIPVSGVFAPTLLTGLFGFVIMVTGVMLLLL